MKRITLSFMMVAAVGVVGAQDPTPPARPARPVPAERPAVAPTPRPSEPRDPYVRIYHPEIDEVRIHAAEIARMARDIDHVAAREAAEAVRAQSVQISEMAREASREASRMANIDVREVAERAREAARYASDAMREWAPMARLEPITPMPAMPAMAPMAPMAVGRYADEFYVPRPYFVQGEPADSMYRLAHEVLNRGDYGRAAQMFKDIAAKYPKSVYENDLPYWEAFARFRIGTTDELQTAAKLLEPRASKLIGVVQAGGVTSISYSNYGRQRLGETDVTALYVRINSVLASRGNNAAAAIVAKAAQSGANTCDRDDMQVKVEAMSALSQMDAAQALPIVRRVLDKKDECSTELRRRAVFILGRRGDSEAATLLASAAKSDPSNDVRVAAIEWLPKVQGDAGVNMLEELLRTDQEERIQRAVVRTLNTSDNQRARSSMRALIDRKDAPTNLRVEAVNSFSSERATNEDAAYLRSLYARAENDRVKDAAINAVARIGGPENDQWILSLARNTSEPSQFRATAISRLMRNTNISIADLVKLYDASDTYDVRSRIVSVLESRKEPEASDKLVDIIRNSTVINIRTQALRALSNRKDPRAPQLYIEILEGKKP